MKPSWNVPVLVLWNRMLKYTLLWHIFLLWLFFSDPPVAPPREKEEDWESETQEVTSDAWESIFGVRRYGRNGFEHLKAFKVLFRSAQTHCEWTTSPLHTDTQTHTPSCILGWLPELLPDFTVFSVQCVPEQLNCVCVACAAVHHNPPAPLDYNQDFRKTSGFMIMWL